MKKSFTIVLLSMLFSVNLFGFFSNDSVIVFPLSNQDKKSQDNWMGVAIAQLLEDDVVALDKYELQTITKIQNDKDSAIKFEKLQNFNFDTAKKFALSRDIDAFVVGEYSLNEGELVIKFVYYKDEIEYKTQITTPLSDILATISYEFYKFLKDIEELDSEMLEKFYVNNPNSLIALQYHSRGLVELYSYMDETLSAKKSVDYVNNGGKEAILKKMQEMKANGTFNIASIGTMMQSMNNNINVATSKMNKTLDKKHLYSGAFYFKEAIKSDNGFGKNYAQLANILQSTSKISAFNVPPKTYIEDLCKQAEESRIPSECKDDVYDYQEIQDGSGQPCYAAERSFNTFTQTLTNPNTGSLDSAFNHIEYKAKCIDKDKMMQTLALGEVAIKDYYKNSSMKDYIHYEYLIAFMYREYEEWEKAKNVYLEIITSLDNYKAPKEKNYENVLFYTPRAIAMMAKQSNIISSNDSSANLNYKKIYKIKAYQKLATFYSKEADLTQTKRYLKLLENYPFEQLDEYINIINISKAYYEIREYEIALLKANLVLDSNMKEDRGAFGRQDTFIELYLYMALLYEKNANYKEALKFADLASGKIQNLQNMIKPNNDNGLKDIRKYYQRVENIQISIYLKKNDAKAYAQLYAKIADKKAQRLYSQNAMHSMVNTQLNRSLNPILDSIKEDRKKLLSLNTIDDNEKILALDEEISTKQKELSLIEKINNVIDRKNSLKEKNLYANLPENSAVLDFFATQDNYYMFIIQKGQIRLKDLGSKKDIDFLIDNREFAKNEKLYNMMFDDIQIKEQRLIIIPTSKLSYLPFEALLSKDGYLIEKKTISYLPSILMLSGEVEQKDIKTITLFANPDFEEEVGSEDTMNKDRTLRGVSFSSLPGTMLEAKKVQRIANKVNVNLKLFIGKDANEENFELQSESDILHIATHGYFVDTATGYNNTGIVLSGVNRSIKNGVDRGIISAKKILDYYNFSKIQLVVLSACDTGAGEISTIDGVQSLGNSFLMVGASNVIMNLWEIPDIETAYLMKLFYKNLLINKLPKDESIRAAKLTMIKRGESYEKWAALVLFGN
ncbi:CHAT domain-containing protein [Sulfurimonas sp. SAG-AH-194-C20]|nr:CHAT domain-containing protein [Sulfurimonas sp. SAG-AH-194-C20]MDF1878134.1 CHAT domain-containing protein [Sulfurimonas sp. SAG-AH-194-C20]